MARSILRTLTHTPVKRKERLEIMEECPVCGKPYGVTHDCRGPSSADAALAGLDRQRLAYLGGLFLAMGFGPEAASGRARLCYLALIAEHQLRASGPAERLAAARAMLGLLTGED